LIFEKLNSELFFQISKKFEIMKTFKDYKYTRKNK